MDPEQFRKDVTFLTSNSQYMNAHKYDGNPDSLSAKVGLLSAWNGFVTKYSSGASEHAFNVVFTSFLTSTAASWATDQDYTVSHQEFLFKFNSFFQTSNESLRSFKNAASFKFTCKDFASEFIAFKTLHGCLEEYHSDDRHFTLMMYAALPQSVIGLLPSTDFTSSDTLYRAVASILTNKPVIHYDINPTPVANTDPDAMEIDSLGIFQISSAAIADVITQYEDFITANESEDSSIVELDAIRTRFARSPDVQRSARNCFYCNKPGHFIRNCHKRRADRSARFSNNLESSKSYESSNRPFR